MDTLKLFDAEFRFMRIVWANEPVNSTELTRLCEKEMGWKKPTTYSTIKKLSERGVLKNEKATVTAIIKREQVQQYECADFLDKMFDNSLPLCLMAFLQDKELTKSEAEHLHKMIEDKTV